MADWNYRATSAGATLTRYTKTNSYRVAIPSTIGGYTVVGISGTTGAPVFLRNNMPSYFTVTFPNTLKSIGNYVFYDQYYINKVSGTISIPNSVIVIGNYAFYQCANLTGNLVLPTSLTSLGESAFLGCRGFTGSLTIPESVTGIGNSAFLGCSGFSGTLTIPENTTVIGDKAFSGCTGISEIVFESSEAPTFLGTGSLGLGTSSNPVTVTITGKRWIVDALQNQGNEYTTFVFNIPPIPSFPLRIGSEVKIYGKSADLTSSPVTEEKKVIIDTEHYVSEEDGYSVVDIDKPTMVSNTLFVTESKTPEDESEFALMVAPGVAMLINTPLNRIMGDVILDGMPSGLLTSDNGLVTVSSIGNGNTMPVASSDGSLAWKELSRSFYINFGWQDTFNIKLYNIYQSNVTRFIDTDGCNIQCVFYDESTGENIDLPYKVNLDQTIEGIGDLHSIDVTCTIPTEIKMDVRSLPSLGGIY